jgi:hypothetical protein
MYTTPEDASGLYDFNQAAKYAGGDEAFRIPLAGGL